MSSKVKIKHTKTYKNNLDRKRCKNNLHILNAQLRPFIANIKTASSVYEGF